MRIPARRAMRAGPIRIPREAALQEHARVEDPNRATLTPRAVEMKNHGVVAVIQNDETDDGSLGGLGSAPQLSNRTHASRVARLSDRKAEAVGRLCEHAANAACYPRRSCSTRARISSRMARTYSIGLPFGSSTAQSSTCV